MVSAFASQLQVIAQKSTHELDLKARRNAHAESLLFDRDVAVKQDFEALYIICIDGFHELCQLDARFREFDYNLFSEQAKVQDRDQMTKAENEALDLVLCRCLTLLGGKILLKPAVKALEWLVRRFRVHVHNVDHLLSTLITFHELPIWANVLAIVPNEKIVGHWKFIRPYLKTTWNVPRHAVAYAGANNDGFFAIINSYVLDACRQQLAHPALLKFWSSIVVEATSTRLRQTRSGRKEVQQQRTDDFLRQILPLLAEGFEIQTSTDLTTTCYTITIILAAQTELEDNIIDSLLLTVAQTLSSSDENVSAALMTIAVLVSRKEVSILPRKALGLLIDFEPLISVLRRMSMSYACGPILVSLSASTVSHFKSKNAARLASFLDDVIRLIDEICPVAVLTEALQPIVAKIFQLDPSKSSDSLVRGLLLSKLHDLNDIETVSLALRATALRLKQDPDKLETLLGSIMGTLAVSAVENVENVDMIDVDSLSDTTAQMFEMVPHESQLTSFLAVTTSPLFGQLADLFEQCCANPDRMTMFTTMRIWASTADQQVLWQSFLLRLACANYKLLARLEALRRLQEVVKLRTVCNPLFLVPYLLVLLSDTKGIRSAVAELVRLVFNVLQQESDTPAWKSASQFYANFPDASGAHASDQHITLFLADTILPTIEECRLDRNHIIQTMQQVFQQNSTEVRKGHKQAVFTFLSQHALNSPLIKLQLGVMSMFGKALKIGTKSVSKTMIPLLEQWSTLPEHDAQQLAYEADLAVNEVDQSLVRIANSNAIDFIESLSQLRLPNSENVAYRPSLIISLFNHVKSEWYGWSSEQQVSATITLFRWAFGDDDTLAPGAQNVLRSVDLNAESLAAVMSNSQIGMSDVKPPPAKRTKRTSSTSSRTPSNETLKAVEDAISKIGMALELLEGNAPEAKPELVGDAFEMMVCLKQLQQNRMDSPYLMNLCLGSTHAMVKSVGYKPNPASVTGVKPEIVTDILRTTDNPQVQTAALQLLASLSTVAPDRMVHNVMPIFTFIGHKMLSKDDDHSVNVINEAIDKIVPALLVSLKASKNAQSYLNAVISILASFTASYEHIPLHRRVAFYQRLLQSVNANDFGFIMLALLARHQSTNPTFAQFIHDTVSQVEAHTQLRLYQQLLHVATDAISSSPKTSGSIFDIQKSTTPAQKQQYAASSLVTAVILLRAPLLAKNILFAVKGDQDVAHKTKLQLQEIFKATLACIQACKVVGGEISDLSKECMDVLLQLPPLHDLLEMLHNVLDDMDEALRPQALRILALQFDVRKVKTDDTRAMALEVLQKLSRYLKPDSDDALLSASLVCVDRIAEACGRKHPQAVSSTAQEILHNLGLSHTSVSAKRTISVILTMASLVEVLRDAAVPLVPQIVQQSLLLFTNITSKEGIWAYFSAICTLLTAVFTHAAFMVSEEQLPSLLRAVILVRLDPPRNGNIVDYSNLVEMVARKMEIDVLIGAIVHLLELEPDLRSAAELMKITSLAIESASKSTVIKHADHISRLFLAVLELESKHQSADTSTDDSKVKLATEVKSASIHFIYKINDATLRPIFESWVDWSTENNTAGSNGSITIRQTSLFDLLDHFFDTLKGIVTSYTTYLLPQISDIIKRVKAGPSVQTTTIPKELLENTLTLLQTIATYDQDAFFAAPSHFDIIGPQLVDLLGLASSKTYRPMVSSLIVPTITALATATIDSPQAHGKLAHHIVQLKSASSPQVRLASIGTLIALTEDPELGDEFIANTIGIGAGEADGARAGGSSVGEIMVYVNEMLEDDDEGVETAVRKWVQTVRGKVGEDIFEV